MAILQGQFAIMLVVEAPGHISIEKLEASFEEVQSRLDLLIVIRQLPETHESAEAEETYAVSVHGADRPGIVSLVTSRIAELGGNIVDLTTHRLGDAEEASYVLLLSVETTGSCTEEDLRKALDEVATRLGVTCVIHAAGNDLF